MLPDTYPIDLRTINYSPIAVGLVLLVLLATWFFPKYGAQHWYRGKAHTLDDQEVVCCIAYSFAEITESLGVPGTCCCHSWNCCLDVMHTMLSILIVGASQKVNFDPGEV